MPSIAGDLAGQVLDLHRPLLGRLGPVAGVDGEEGRALGVADEQDAVRPEGSGPADFRSGFPCLRLAVGSPAPAETAIMIAPAIASAAARVQFLGILSSPWLRIEMSRDEATNGRSGIMATRGPISIGKPRRKPIVFASCMEEKCRGSRSLIRAAIDRLDQPFQQPPPLPRHLVPPEFAQPGLELVPGQDG